jgi:hypothetical protein
MWLLTHCGEAESYETRTSRRLHQSNACSVSRTCTSTVEFADLAQSQMCLADLAGATSYDPVLRTDQALALNDDKYE